MPLKDQSGLLSKRPVPMRDGSDFCRDLSDVAKGGRWGEVGLVAAKSDASRRGGMSALSDVIVYPSSKPMPHHRTQSRTRTRTTTITISRGYHHGFHGPQ